MWNRKFWKATIERMIRGSAVAVSAAYFVGDGVFNSMEISTWKDVGGLAIGGAFSALLLCLGGGVVSGNGPSFTTDEAIKPGP